MLGIALLIIVIISILIIGRFHADVKALEIALERQLEQNKESFRRLSEKDDEINSLWAKYHSRGDEIVKLKDQINKLKTGRIS